KGAFMKLQAKAKQIKWTAAMLMFIFVVVLFFASDWMGKVLYPIYYKEEIRANAQNYGVDPLLIASIIRVESNYKPDKVSAKNAVGMMQLMPDTAAWLIESHKFEHITLQDLYTAAVNIEIGTLYVSL